MSAVIELKLRSLYGLMLGGNTVLLFRNAEPVEVVLDVLNGKENRIALEVELIRTVIAA